MKTVDDKRKEKETYIIQVFGKPSWVAIGYFQINVLDILNTIKVTQNLACDDNFIKSLNLTPITNNPNSDLLRIKQQIVLNNIMKINIIIESFLRMIDILSKGQIGYKNLIDGMFNYKTLDIFKIIEHIKSNQLTNIEKDCILCLVDIETLTVDEQNILNNYYERIREWFFKILKEICEFYEKFSIFFFRSKHGLTIIPEIFSTHNQTFEFSSMICYDNKTEINKFGKFFILNKFDSSTNANVIAYLNFNKKLVDEINLTTSNIAFLTSSICQAHKIKGFNCGDNYLPFTELDINTKEIIFHSPINISEEEHTKLNPIIQKVLSNMHYVSDNTIKVDLKIETRSDILNSILNDSMTVCWKSR